MITSIDGVRGLPLQAVDGEIGTVEDLLFDDERWRVRYLAADTGGWLTGRQVLLAPEAVGGIDERVTIGLTREQVEGSPPLSADEPVSRQWETDLFGYYGYVPYWGFAAGYPVAGAYAPIEPGLSPDGVVEPGEGDPHLRSAREVTGYHVQATDDEVGHVEDLLLDDATWSIDAIVVDTRNILPGRKVVVPVTEIEEISFADRIVRVNMTREGIERRPEADV
jgi:uncharacterized protein YrrD